VSSDHLGLNGIDTLEQLAEVKRIIIEVARDCVVLNADDPLVRNMRRRCSGQHRVVLDGRARLGGARHDRRALPSRRQGDRAESDPSAAR
jgi:UDP-N-acetylmuramyl tripeptide synthase